MNLRKSFNILSVLAVSGLAVSLFSSVSVFAANLDVSSSGSLPVSGSSSAVQILSDGNILYGGSFGLVKASSNGQAVLHTNNSISVNDIASSGATNYIAANTGLFTYNSATDALSAASSPCGFTSIKAVSATGGNVVVADSNSSQICINGSVTVNVNRTQIAGVAVSQNRVYVTGYQQVSANLQSPYILSYDLSGNQVASRYGASSGFTADSRGIAIEIGQDGNVYFLGSVDGGNNAFDGDPNRVNIDNFTNLSGAGIGKFTYYARINAETLVPEVAQFVVSRLSNGNANSVNPVGITADEDGNVYVVASASASYKGRANSTINGTSIGNYAGSDGIVLKASPNLSSWEIITAFTGTNASGMAGVSAVGGNVALIGNTDGSVIEVNSIGSGSGPFGVVFDGIVPTDEPTDPTNPEDPTDPETPEEPEPSPTDPTEPSDLENEEKSSSEEDILLPEIIRSGGKNLSTPLIALLISFSSFGFLGLIKNKLEN